MRRLFGHINWCYLDILNIDFTPSYFFSTALTFWQWPNAAKITKHRVLLNIGTFWTFSQLLPLFWLVQAKNVYCRVTDAWCVRKCHVPSLADSTPSRASREMRAKIENRNSYSLSSHWPLPSSLCLDVLFDLLIYYH